MKLAPQRNVRAAAPVGAASWPRFSGARPLPRIAARRPLRRESSKRDVAAGFTLIELVITLSVLALLSSIAYPAYLEQTGKGRRAEAHVALLKTAAKQEKYFADHGTFTADMTELGLNADPYVTERGFYSIDATLSDGGRRYVLTATRAGAQVNDTVCGDLTFSSLNIRSAINNSDTNPTKHCW